MDFKGRAKRLSDGAIGTAARTLACDPAALRAVIAVESQGGFDAAGRPRMLFERHYFHRLTNGQFSASHPEISAPRWGGYGAASAQYDRLARAIACDWSAALRSASWGMFQIMGDNHALAGFGDVEAFVCAMMDSEDHHLAAFVAFACANGLQGSLQRQDWRAFARIYNGPAFAKHRYDARLAEAFARHARLKMGSHGATVRALQARLEISSDGIFGPETDAALRRFQRSTGLVVDGIAGPATRAALRLG